MKVKLVTFFALLFVTTIVFGQKGDLPLNWFNLDFETDGYYGVGTEKTYQDLLKGKKSQTIIVAVIDGGVDYLHEDLKDVMWVNTDEIPGNGIDDDLNGYIDDIHGWNFIGGKDGKNVGSDLLEVTRLYVKLNKKYFKKNPDKLSRKEKKEYQRYLEVKKDYIKRKKEAKENAARYESAITNAKKIAKSLGKETVTLEELPNFNAGKDEELAKTVELITRYLNGGYTFEKFLKQMNKGYEYYTNSLKNYYNPDNDPRSIVGDDYSNSSETSYGNNDIKGPDASHGTHVSGIIAANRYNDIGMQGVADNVRIMGVRVVPDGDERDKDVANGIMYAVDNGAKIINMSFGKPYAWDKNIVDKAVKYAVRHGVLLVHAAMNDSKNTDVHIIYPNDRYEKRGLFGPRYAKSWLEVGASSWKKGEDAIATFSNYGKTNVDVFAPGVDIYSTTPGNTYEHYNGTSMATPVTAGVAAVLMSYFPELSAKEVKDIIMQSVTKVTWNVKKTDTGELAPMTELCVSGGIVNLYKAVQLAMKKDEGE